MDNIEIVLTFTRKQSRVLCSFSTRCQLLQTTYLSVTVTMQYSLPPVTNCSRLRPPQNTSLYRGGRGVLYERGVVHVLRDLHRPSWIV